MHLPDGPHVQSNVLHLCNRGDSIEFRNVLRFSVSFYNKVHIVAGGILRRRVCVCACLKTGGRNMISVN